MATDPGEALQDFFGMPRRLQCLAEHDIVEGRIGIGIKVVIDIALDHRETMSDAGIDALLAQLHAATIDLFGAREVIKQCTIATADIQHTTVRRNHIRDELKISAERRQRRAICYAHTNPRNVAQPSMKPPKVRRNSGSSSRKASCPLSVSISTKLTFAATAFRA